jgi:hypothetical protein
MFTENVRSQIIEEMRWNRQVIAYTPLTKDSVWIMLFIQNMNSLFKLAGIPTYILEELIVE